MTGVLVPTGEVTLCCGGHRPPLGEASRCSCCAECVTNVSYARHPMHARRAVARAERCVQVSRRAAYRRAEYAVGISSLCDLGRATAHAVRVLPLVDPSMQGRLP